MADLTVTAASVVKGADAIVEHGIAGAAISAGQAVYKDANGLYQLADSNSATALARVARGIALNNAAANQPLAIQRSGSLTIGASLTAGLAYYLSDTPGGICPVGDVGSGEYPCILGMASSTSILKLGIQSAGVAV